MSQIWDMVEFMVLLVPCPSPALGRSRGRTWDETLSADLLCLSHHESARTFASGARFELATESSGVSQGIGVAPLYPRSQIDPLVGRQQDAGLWTRGFSDEDITNIVAYLKEMASEKTLAE
jgi:hypothetical protein